LIRFYVVLVCTDVLLAENAGCFSPVKRLAVKIYLQSFDIQFTAATHANSCTMCSRCWDGIWLHSQLCHGSTYSFRRLQSMETKTDQSSWFRSIRSTLSFKWCGFVPASRLSHLLWLSSRCSS